MVFDQSIFRDAIAQCLDRQPTEEWLNAPSKPPADSIKSLRPIVGRTPGVLYAVLARSHVMDWSVQAELRAQPVVDQPSRRSDALVAGRPSPIGLGEGARAAASAGLASTLRCNAPPLLAGFSPFSSCSTDFQARSVSWQNSSGVMTSANSGLKPSGVRFDARFSGKVPTDTCGSARGAKQRILALP